MGLFKVTAVHCDSLFILFPLLLCLNPIAVTVAVELKLDANYVLKWYQEADKTQIVIEISVNTPGYAGFGISTNGVMLGADIVVISSLDNDKLDLKDMHGVGNMIPILDKKQDYKLLNSKVAGTKFWAKFSRLIDTCDQDDVKITESTLYIIWSYGLTKNGSKEIGYHLNNRGSRAVNLLDPVYETLNISMYEKWPLRQNIVLTEERTLYWCSFHKVNALGRKHQVVGFAVNIDDPLAKVHVHHASLFNCNPPSGVNPDEFFQPFVNSHGYDCYFSKKQPRPPISNCKNLELQWAYGGTPTMFPENVGVPFGESTRYFMTMMLADNPDLTPGIRFKTGLDLLFTSKTREMDAGLFQIGLNSTKTYSLTVPPNSTNYVLSSHCPTPCTAGFPKTGITVFMYSLHLHLAGRKMRVRHFRDMTELPWIANDENYDENYQNNRMLRKPVKILPGDHLTVECTYDSTDRNGSVVIGGQGLLDEICQVSLMYYPRSPVVSWCGSNFPQQDVLEFMGISSVSVNDGDNDPVVLEPEYWGGRQYTEVVEDDIEWTVEKRWSFQLLTKEGYHETECTGIGPGIRIPSKYPVKFKEFVPPSVCLKKAPGAASNIHANLHFPVILVTTCCTLFLFTY